MDVSVIIVSYNTRDLTLDSIDSVKKFTSGVSYEVIVVDNASSDGTVEAVRERFPDIKLIVNSENVGFGRANNQAVRMSRARYVFLLNSDAYLIDNSILSFVQFMDQPSNADVAVCGGELISGDNQKMASYGNFPSLLEAISSIGLHKLYSNYYRSKLSIGVINTESAIRAVDYISGADMFVRRKVMEETGGFDEDFFLYFEETELSFRIGKLGYKSVLIPQVRVVHLEGASHANRGEFNYRRYRLFTSSQMLYFRKTGGLVTFWMAKLIYVLHLLVYSLIGKERGGLFKKIGIIIKA
ncbi:glycosyltransferase family 2 protein [Chitinophaga varians]|uniref:Glycosyltransferase family 2 protein n=1 Tax=Chitinophaga varians TaxID=2202339 RepID=A0A847RE10_9BACT|nr:glycosyltransferase family 2 protein [Chitinophaga varians]NLR65289.1 glycosyltransferase family 2 protein [Chitinophaga varians]